MHLDDKWFLVFAGMILLFVFASGTVLVVSSTVTQVYGACP